MTPQEKEMITTLLARLKGAGAQPKDPEADGLIRQAVAEQPDAPYYLVQTVLIQDLSLGNAQQRIAELERQVAAAQTAAPAAPPSFLGGLFGHGQPAAPPPGSVPAAGPWSRGPQAMPPQPMAQPGYAQPGYAQQPQQPMGGGGIMGGLGGGGFLRSAATTAAGIAGGALLFEGISSLFGQNHASSIMGNQAGIMPGLGESVTNNYYGDAGAGASSGQGDYGGDAGSSGGQDYAGGDFSGGADSGGSDSGFDNSGDSSGGDFSSSSC